MTRLTDFLALLADPDEFASYESDRDGFMSRLGVPAIARAAVLSEMPAWIEHLAIAEVLALKQAAAGTPGVAPVSRRGLTIVGTGISVGQMTGEARAYIVRARKLFYAPADPVTERVLLSLNPTAESLAIHYKPGLPRTAAYQAMADRILAALVESEEVCAAFYGHPGVFVTASHAAIARARSAGWPAKMLPAVSSLDCLYADLGVDPAYGCMVMEAQAFVRKPMTSAPDLNLVLLQIGAIDEPDVQPSGTNGRNLPRLLECLADLYPPQHAVVVYEASTLAVCAPRISKTTVSELGRMKVSDRSTLYVPALRS